ncbi:MAG: hypothetical protein M1325_01210 [Actinobacteria bacterium]|nr:hypothetical protein [Actinomycetota bacterium]
MTGVFDLNSKLTVDLTDLEQIPPRLRQTVAEAGDQTARIRTEVDAKDAHVALRGLEQDVAKVDKMVAQPQVSVATTDVEQGFKRLQYLAQHLDQLEIRPEIDAMQITLARKRVMELERRWEELNAAPKVTLKVDNSQVQEAAKAVETVVVGPSAPIRPGGPREGATGISGIVAGLAKARTVQGLVTTYAIGRTIREVERGIKATVVPAVAEQRRQRAVAHQFGTQGPQIEMLVKQLSDATGYLAQDFEQAALAGRALGPLSDIPAEAAAKQTEAIRKLLPAAAGIAATSPDKSLQNVAGAFSELTSAINGSESAQQRLGIDLSDVHMKTVAWGGALANTWETLSEAEKNQHRYSEAIRQTSDLLGQAEDEGSLEYQWRQLTKQIDEMALALGGDLIDNLAGLVFMINAMVEAVKKVPDLIPDWAKDMAKTLVERSPVVGPQVRLWEQIGRTTASWADKAKMENAAKSLTNEEAIRVNYYVNDMGLSKTDAIELAKKVTRVDAERGTSTLIPTPVVTLRDATRGGLTLDAGSYAPSNY